MDSSNLIAHFRDNKIKFRIEVEGKEIDLTNKKISFPSDYVKVVPNNANKWGCEYRLYFNGSVPKEYESIVKKNSFYHQQKYNSIINSNELIKDMLNKGCCWGDNYVDIYIYSKIK